MRGRFIEEKRASLNASLLTGEAPVQVASMRAQETGQPTLILGVDTYMRQEMATHYQSIRRLKTQSNSNGFVPGEAGSSLLVGPPRTGGAELRVLSTALECEPVSAVESGRATGDALARAVKRALDAAGRQFADLDLRLSDLNGEQRKFKESAIVQIRLERRAIPAPFPLEHWHPIEYVGDVGAAIMPLLLGFNEHAQRHGFARGPLALLHCSGDDGSRAAIITQWGAN